MHMGTIKPNGRHGQPDGLLLLFLAFFVFFVFFPTGTIGAGFNLTLLHSSDTFSSITAVDDFVGSCKPLSNMSYLSPNGVNCYGGMARMLTLIERERARTNNRTFLVDAGNIIATSLYYYVYGAPLVGQYYARLGYDGVTWQVQDLVKTLSDVASFMQVARADDPAIQFVSSNIQGYDAHPKANGTVLPRYVIKTFPESGDKVGFVGTVAKDVDSLIADDNVSATDEAAALLVAVAALGNRGVNKIVAAVSSNASAEAVLKSVPGIDVLVVPGQVQANSNAGILSARVGPYPMVYQAPWEQPVLVVSAASYGRLMGVLDVEFDENGVIASWSGDAVVLDDSVPADPELQGQLVAQYAQLQSTFSRVIGWTAVNLAYETACLFGECTIGNFLSDSYRAFANTVYDKPVQIGFSNAGSVRGAIPAGPVTLGQEQTVFPFGTNVVYAFGLQGLYILQALENGVSLARDYTRDVNNGGGKFLSVSGIRFTWNPDETPGLRVIDAYVEVTPGSWKLLDLNAMYTIASDSWLTLNGGDDYSMIPAHSINVRNLGNNMNGVLLEALSKNVTSIEMGRIVNTTVATRRTCIAPDGSTCNNNGYCLTGVCQCTVAGTSGEFCTSGGASDSSSSSADVAIALGVSLPVAAVLACLVLIVLIALLVHYRMRRVQDSWEIDMAELDMGPQLGAGGFGQVYRAVWKGTDVAVKVVSAQSAGRAAQETFKQEVSVMTALRHPNVVLFMAACTRPPTLCIVMELMELGSLFDLLHNALVVTLPLALCLKLAYQGAKGMHFLHSSGIVHRDLKSLNMLLDNKWNLKVSDFGLTKFRADLKRGDEVQGTIHWTAPEVLQELSDVDYMQADVYSFGIIMWELLTREEPYRDMSPAAIAVGVIRDGMRPKRLDDIPTAQRFPEFEAIMAECWNQDPVMRPSFLEIMSRLSSLNNDESASSTGSSSSLFVGSFHKYNPHKGQSSGSSSSQSSQQPQHTARGGMAPPAPSVDEPLTVVFTDIVGAAQLWEADPQAMREAMTLHNDLLRKLLKQHQGYESVFLKNHAGGQGYFCFVFSKPRNALRWCEDVQRKLLEVNWPTTLTQFEPAQEESGPHGTVIYRGPRVRMGVHFGNATRKRDHISGRFEYSGPSVTVATELTMRAEGGHVLVSGMVLQAMEEEMAAGGVKEKEEHEYQRERFRKMGTVQLNSTAGDRTVSGSVIVDIIEVLELCISGIEDRCEWTATSHLSGASSQLERTGNTASSSNSSHDDLRASRRGGMDFIGSANACRWIIPFEDISINDESVGQGSYGFVSKGRWKGVDVAVKRLAKQKLDEDTMLRFREESALLSELRHPNVVLFIGACLKPPNVCLVTEWLPKGSLRDVLTDHSIKLPWNVRLAMMKGIALGLAYLHSQSPPVLHRDLKSSNVLVDESWNAKIADFGLARIKQDNATMTRCGTPAWTAPEIMRHERYTERADIYSLGIVMWEVATRKLPLAGDNLAKVALDVLEGKRPPVPNNVPQVYASLMTSCWHRKPHKRPSAEHVCRTIESLMESSSLMSDSPV